jgi:fibrillarin-like pre-rRNA processing protein
VERDGRRNVATRNLTPGKQTYGEDLLRIDGEEYRLWDPFRSKLAAAILKGLPRDVIKEGDKVLYLGTSTGTTSSHISDIVGNGGLLFGVEMSSRVAREFVENVARARANVIPYVADARNADSFTTLGKVDVVYCDIAQQDQTEIAMENCRVHLKTGGRLILVVKARSIDVLASPKEIFRQEGRKLAAAGFNVEKTIELDPFDKDHALILASR